MFEASVKKDGKRVDVTVVSFLQDYGVGTLAVCISEDSSKLFTCPIKDVTARRDSCGRLRVPYTV